MLKTIFLYNSIIRVSTQLKAYLSTLTYHTEAPEETSHDQREINTRQITDTPPPKNALDKMSESLHFLTRETSLLGPDEIDPTIQVVTGVVTENDEKHLVDKIAGYWFCMTCDTYRCDHALQVAGVIAARTQDIETQTKPVEQQRENNANE